jgi:hypothetical protein
MTRSGAPRESPAQLLLVLATPRPHAFYSPFLGRSGFSLGWKYGASARAIAWLSMGDNFSSFISSNMCSSGVILSSLRLPKCGDLPPRSADFFRTLDLAILGSLRSERKLHIVCPTDDRDVFGIKRSIGRHLNFQVSILFQSISGNAHIRHQG